MIACTRIDVVKNRGMTFTNWTYCVQRWRYNSPRKTKLRLEKNCSGNDLIEQKYQNVGELIDGKHLPIYAGMVE